MPVDQSRAGSEPSTVASGHALVLLESAPVLPDNLGSANVDAFSISLLLALIRGAVPLFHLLPCRRPALRKLDAQLFEQPPGFIEQSLRLLPFKPRMLLALRPQVRFQVCLENADVPSDAHCAQLARLDVTAHGVVMHLELFRHLGDGQETFAVQFRSHSVPIIVDIGKITQRTVLGSL